MQCYGVAHHATTHIRRDDNQCFSQRNLLSPPLPVGIDLATGNNSSDEDNDDVDQHQRISGGGAADTNSGGIGFGLSAADIRAMRAQTMRHPAAESKRAFATSMVANFGGDGGPADEETASLRDEMMDDAPVVVDAASQYELSPRLRRFMLGQPN